MRQDGSGYGVFGQRYDSSGAPLGPEFRVNTLHDGRPESIPSVAVGRAPATSSSSGRATPRTARRYGVFGQRYASSGAPLGTEFRVNTYTTGNQGYPSVAADAAGNFVVVWQSDGQDGSSYGVFGQRYGQIVPVELMRLSVE